jgi:ParB family transcriptional regulator, chromosome partitioning protein
MDQTTQSTSTELASFQGALEFSTELVGVSEKTALASHSLTKGGSFLCMVEDIHVLPDFNPRIRNEALRLHIRGIADSILAEGYYQDKPISVYAATVGKKPTFFITDGHNRFEALLIAISEGAEISEVPIVIKDRSTNMEDLTVALVRSNEGLKLGPLEIAVCCKRLIGFRWPISKIALRIGKTEEYVNQLLTLAGAPAAIRQMIEQGETTAAVAISALRTHGEDAPAVLGKALDAAKAEGKAKVTTRFMPEQVRKVAMRKAAPKMLDAIQQVKVHKSYATLPADLQKLIDELLTTLNAPAGAEEQVAAGETATA